MDEAQHQLLAKLQTLDTDAYLRKDKSSVRNLPTQALQQGVRGLLLSAPRTLDGRTVQAVPALLLTARSQARSDALPFRDSAVVVATDLERGDSYAGPAFVVDHSKVPAGVAGDPPPAPPAAHPVHSAEEQARLDALGHGDSAGLMWFDFRELLGLPVESSRYLLRVFDFDEVSNPALVAVTADKAAVELSAAAADAVVERSHPSAQSTGFPRHGRDERTPALTGPGAALTLGQVAFREGTRHVPVHGALRLELTRPMIVAPPSATGGHHARTPRAVLRATVLVLMKNMAQPMLAQVEVPIFGERELHAGDVVDAAFAVDLATILPPKPRAGLYQVYLLAGPFLSGPYPLSVPEGA